MGAPHRTALVAICVAALLGPAGPQPPSPLPAAGAAVAAGPLAADVAPCTVAAALADFQRRPNYTLDYRQETVVDGQALPPTRFHAVATRRPFHWQAWGDAPLSEGPAPARIEASLAGGRIEYRVDNGPVQTTPSVPDVFRLFGAIDPLALLDPDSPGVPAGPGQIAVRLDADRLRPAFDRQGLFVDPLDARLRLVVRPGCRLERVTGRVRFRAGPQEIQTTLDLRIGSPESVPPLRLSRHPGPSVGPGCGSCSSGV